MKKAGPRFFVGREMNRRVASRITTNVLRARGLPALILGTQYKSQGLIRRGSYESQENGVPPPQLGLKHKDAILQSISSHCCFVIAMQFQPN